jgi:pyrroline-5-carboxylate reductase
MAEALIGGLVAARAWEPSAIAASDVSEERRDLLKRRFGVRACAGNREAVANAEVVVLAVKPQTLEEVLLEVGQQLAGRAVISIAAGVPIRWIAERTSASARIIRAMPNQPALVREGMCAVAAGAGVTEEDLRIARTIFEAVGKVVPVEERVMDAVTGLSGSGPAYVFLAIEALADGGVKMGLPRATAELLAAQTLLGAARMVLESGEHPARLKDRVASQGGTTIAGLHALERGGYRATLIAAVEAATKRSQELGRPCS